MPKLNDQEEQELRSSVLHTANFYTESLLAQGSHLSSRAVRQVALKISQSRKHALSIPDKPMMVKELSDLIVEQFNSDPSASAPA